ncbi:MAG: hypothetical protein LBF64_06190 [Oscillospiraceae bacterium]|nr:hypothetical protein [Oscillospiraceae bacterium]
MSEAKNQGTKTQAPKTQETKTQAVTFSKARILKSRAFANRRDLLTALLEDRDYTIDEVNLIMDNFLKTKGVK